MLKSPFPYFGGKRRVAPMVWERFGDVPNMVEPFCGSLAVLLGRPSEPRIETVNDIDALISNFWRSCQADPEAVAHWADWPINEVDLHARHLWLVNQVEFVERMKADPQYFDAKVAGWWVWGICQWIGSGWCSRPDWAGRGTPWATPQGISKVHAKLPDLKRGHGLSRQIPDLNGDSGAAGRGIHASGDPWQTRPGLTYSQGVHKKLPSIGRGGERGVLSPLLYDEPEQDNGPITEWMQALGNRLRRVRVCCGDWKRILGPSPTWKIGLTAVFLDPPYAGEGRDVVYSNDSATVGQEVSEWCRQNGDNPLLRIALCGYEGEHDLPGWEQVEWRAVGGYGNQGKQEVKRGRDNAKRERIWFSPACLKGQQRSLFDE